MNFLIWQSLPNSPNRQINKVSCYIIMYYSIATQYKKVKGSEFTISDDVGHLTERVVQQNFLTISWTLIYYYLRL